jgi:hypothetical protein
VVDVHIHIPLRQIWEDYRSCSMNITSLGQICAIWLVDGGRVLGNEDNPWMAVGMTSSTPRLLVSFIFRGASLSSTLPHPTSCPG